MSYWCHRTATAQPEELNFESDEHGERHSEADTESLPGDGASAVSVLTEPDAEVRVPRVTSVEIRAAFEFLDTVDLRATFSRRACVMKTTPHFLRGPCRNALRLAMEEAVRAGEVHQNRGWKLFLLLPRLLLHRPPRGGKVHRSKWVERFDDFARGSWSKMLEASVKCDEDAAAHTWKRRRHQVEDVQRRAVSSAGRQAMEGAELAPGSEETLRELRNPLKRPPRARALLPPQNIGT